MGGKLAAPEVLPAPAGLARVTAGGGGGTGKGGRWRFAWRETQPVLREMQYRRQRRRRRREDVAQEGYQRDAAYERDKVEDDCENCEEDSEGQKDAALRGDVNAVHAAEVDALVSSTSTARRLLA